MARKRTEEAAAVVETKQPIICGCGCGLSTRGGRYLPGHDAKHRSNLLKAHDAGDSQATAALIEHGFYTAESLAARSEKGGDKAANAEARRAAKITKLRTKIEALTAELAELEAAS